MEFSIELKLLITLQLLIVTAVFKDKLCTSIPDQAKVNN